MKVLLKRPFSNGFDFWHHRNNPNEMDDSMLPYLPSDAVILGKTRDETRLAVLKERKKLKLDAPNAAAGEIDYNGRGNLKTDEELLAGDVDHSAANKEAQPTKATLAANLKTAQNNLRDAQKKLAEAKTEPAKGEAKAEVAMAEKGINEAEGAIAAFEDAE